MADSWQDLFKDKKITVMGLGVLGRGVGDVAFLAESGAQLIVTDLKKGEDLQESLQKLTSFTNITYVLGEHRLEDFRDRDMILKAAGVPLDNPFIAEAQKHHIPVEMSSALFSRYAMNLGAQIIGITGTRGKSTTTHLLYDVLQKAYENSPHRIFLGGNVRGVSTLPFIKEIKSGDIAVLELDSWQLQGFGEDTISPQVSVFTTFLSDHMNYYKGDMDRYLLDKAQIFLHQKPDNLLFLGKQVAELVQNTFGSQIKSHVTVTDSSDFPYGWSLMIPGIHNRYNAALVIAVARSLHIEDRIIQEVVEAFKGVPGRLELIKEVSNVKIYNDTTSTMPDATRVGLESVSNGQNVVLIMGGADKTIDMTPLAQALPLYTKKVILLPGTGTEKFKPLIPKNVDVTEVSSLSEAVTLAVHSIRPGDVILFSPAFASFGLFKNEFDRGDQFNTLIKNL